MGTRYNKGDIVKHKESGQRYKIERVLEPQSDSPTYKTLPLAEFKASELKKVDDAVKEVTIRKSQLFENFHQDMIGKASGRTETHVLEIWGGKDTAKEKWKQSGEYYPDNAPIATVGWQSLSEGTSYDMKYHTSELDAKRDVRDSVSEIDAVEEVDKEGVKTNIEAQNGGVLKDIWHGRRRELVPEEVRTMEHIHRYEKIKINWVDDISEREFLEQKFDI